MKMQIYQVSVLLFISNVLKFLTDINPIGVPGPDVIYLSRAPFLLVLLCVSVREEENRNEEATKNRRKDNQYKLCKFRGVGRCELLSPLQTFLQKYH